MIFDFSDFEEMNSNFKIMLSTPVFHVKKNQRKCDIQLNLTFTFVLGGALYPWISGISNLIEKALKKKKKKRKLQSASLSKNIISRFYLLFYL